MVQKNIQTIYYLLGIIAFILILLFGVSSFPELIKIIIPSQNIQNNEAPFSISISPSFIEEKQSEGYNDIPIKFTLTLNPNKNITSLGLKEDNILVDRVNRTAQTKVSSIRWTKTSSSSYVFLKETYTNPYSNTLTAEGYLWDCPNCFIGEDHPYTFTFTFTYSEEGGPPKVYTTILELPIR